MINIPVKIFLCVIALTVFAVPVFGQGAAIEPCPATPAPAKPGSTPPRPETRARLALLEKSDFSVRPLCPLCLCGCYIEQFLNHRGTENTEIAQRRSPIGTFQAKPARLLTVDASIPDDPEVLKIIAPYSERVRELSKVIGRLEGNLSKTGIGGGTLGNFVTDAVKAQAKAKLAKPIVLAMMNNGGLRKNEIAAGELRASDIFELLPFENALVAIDVTGVQLEKILQVVTRDAQSGARIEFKWNDRDRPEFISGKLVDENGKEHDIDPNQTYTILTIDYLMRLNSGAYAILQEATNQMPLNITLRDAVMNYVKSETAAGRSIRPVADNRFVQIGPGPKNAEAPR